MTDKHGEPVAHPSGTNVRQPLPKPLPVVDQAAEYSKMTKAQLIACATDANLDPSGTKAQLIDRLMAATTAFDNEELAGE